MPNFMDNVAFRVYAVCTTILVFKMVTVALLTGRARIRLQAFITPEDARLNKVAECAHEPPEIQRLHRLHQNDVENILPFFAVGLVYVLSGASPLGATAYFSTFTVARVLHTIFYLAKLQPWRSIVFTVGLLCMVMMLVQILRAVL